MVRSAHHPEPSRRTNFKIQIPKCFKPELIMSTTSTLYYSKKDQLLLRSSSLSTFFIIFSNRVTKLFISRRERLWVIFSKTCFLVVESCCFIFLPFAVRFTLTTLRSWEPLLRFTNIFFSIRSTTPVIVGPSLETLLPNSPSTIPSSLHKVMSTSNWQGVKEKLFSCLS